jgi:hypothetical protein
VDRFVSLDAPSRCGTVRSQSSVQVKFEGKLTEYDWTIPASELPVVRGQVWLSLVLYDPIADKASFYPAEPFRRVYVLNVTSSERGIGTEIAKKPEPEPPKPILLKSRPELVKNASMDALKAEEAKIAAARQQLEQERAADAADAQKREQDEAQRAAEQQKQLDDLRAKAAEQERLLEAQKAQAAAAEDVRRKEEQQRREQEQQNAVRQTPYAGPSSGVLIWEGTVLGTQMITIEDGHADMGSVTGLLPGVPVLIQPTDPKRVAIASAPNPGSNYKRIVIRATANGRMRIVLHWSLPS